MIYIIRYRSFRHRYFEKPSSAVIHRSDHRYQFHGLRVIHAFYFSNGYRRRAPLYFESLGETNHGCVQLARLQRI